MEPRPLTLLLLWMLVFPAQALEVDVYVTLQEVAVAPQADYPASKEHCFACLQTKADKFAAARSYSLETPDTKWRNFKAENFGDVANGMSVAQAAYILGSPPFLSEETWFGVETHYCVTGQDSDIYYVLRFKDGQLFGKDVYSVAVTDVGATGHCSFFIKRGSYRALTPSQ